MKRTIIIMVLSSTISLCIAQNPHSTKAVKSRIVTIYKDIFKRCRTLNYGYYIDSYFSRPYAHVCEQFFQLGIDPQEECNHWTLSHEHVQNLSMKILSVKLLNQNKAEAVISVNCNGIITKTTLKMLFENGKWRINDFVRNGISELQCLKTQLTNLSIQNYHTISEFDDLCLNEVLARQALHKFYNVMVFLSKLYENSYYVEGKEYRYKLLFSGAEPQSRAEGILYTNDYRFVYLHYPCKCIFNGSFQRWIEDEYAIKPNTLIFVEGTFVSDM